MVGSFNSVYRYIGARRSVRKEEVAVKVINHESEDGMLQLTLRAIIFPYSVEVVIKIMIRFMMHFQCVAVIAKVVPGCFRLTKTITNNFRKMAAGDRCSWKPEKTSGRTISCGCSCADRPESQLVG